MSRPFHADYDVRTTGDAIAVDAETLTIRPGGAATVKVTVSSRANDARWRFGAVTLEPASASLPPLHLPVAYRPMQGRVTLASACDPGRVAVAQTAQCRVTVANTGYDDTVVTVSSTVDKGLRPFGPPSQAAFLPGVRPGVPSLSDLDDRRFRKLGVEPDPIGDEELVTYDVPEFSFAGQRYQRIGVVSNGYLVIGGGSGQDIRPVAPGEVADDRPNNVLAPYWADLDGTGERGVQVAGVQADGRRWIVVDWHVKHYDTTERVHFQVWIAAGGEEQIRFAYDKAAPPRGHGGKIGAENAVGQGELRELEPAADIAVTSPGGRDGGTLDYVVMLQGVEASPDSTLTISMTTDNVPGTTVVHTRLPVISP